MNLEKLNIPKQWEIKKLGDICLPKEGLRRGPFGSAIKKEYFVNKGYKVYEQSNAIYDDVTTGRYFINESKFNELRNFEVLPGDFIVSCSGTLGKISQLPADAIPGVINQALLRIRLIPNLVDAKYFLYYFRSAKFQRMIFNQSQGTAMNNLIGIKDFKEVLIPVPPFNEQKLIVTKIEALISELDRCIETLTMSKTQLTTHKRAILKWAFEGRLTNKNVNGSLPKKWKWTTFEDVCTKIGDIDHKMPKQLQSGYPYVSTKDFTDDLKISFENVKYISEADYLNLSRKIKPERGDIIFPRYGTIGKNILVDFDKAFLVSYSCAVLKPNHDLISSKYAYLYSLSPKITEEIRKYTVETTQANIGIASIKKFIFPLPPIEEQNLIVQEVEDKLSICDKIDETISESLKQAEVLKQSIFKKAFEGKLLNEN